MKFSNRVLSSLLVISFIFLAATTEMGLADKICKTRSDRFTGLCLSDNSCAIICRQFEKFESGHCGGAFLRCLCTKAC
ncbi:PREDICTED: defensin-like protein 8 [Camelina sativa]|uniref:Defensin-like protein 8 n=1 Tax=Camelina sativa TaxID=90675 RepID=A0ABM1QGF4_CAMSA|nr:PREDICTED: defensin-like protein 8 [Camelina sativa]